MGAKSGLALKALQWCIRGIQFLSCAVVLALFSYFLAVASRHNFNIPTWSKAVEGISGIAIILDIAFVGAFIYVAQANRGGASSCTNTVNTLFGTRSATDKLGSGLPSFQQICQMQKAVLAVSIIAIAFFLISAFVEVILVRHRRKEHRFGPGPANNYTSGYGKRGGFFGRFRRRKGSEEEAINPNLLPEHTHPEQVRPSYHTDGTGALYNKQGESGFQHDGQTAYPEEATYPASGQNYGYAR
ncbi:hypothetical protein ONZ43_g756 [Nemania bipapillata]|uniref:Uncharacterized protein n=1 Tax=Nemania bipapillata TaxID=110536 RepID=A0ACC2J767_9PEZI|nr:hypothetical protein ONZ43_g756 [Nemania bipapillata]